MRTVVDAARDECRYHLRNARICLHALEYEATQIHWARKIPSSGQAVMAHRKLAEELLANIEEDLGLYRAALARLSEGVDPHAAV